MKSLTLASLKAELDAARVRAAAPVTTAIVVRDPPKACLGCAQDRQGPDGSAPHTCVEPDDTKKNVSNAATMFAGAAMGSQLGDIIDKKLGVGLPGIGSMFLGVLSAFGGAIMKDSGDPETVKTGAMLTNLGVGAAAAGVAQMGAEMAERNKPDPVVVLAQETLEFEAKHPAHYGHDVVGLDGGAYCEDCERDLTDEEWAALKATRMRTR